MTTVQIDRLTVDEFVLWAESRPENVQYELHDGEIVEMTFPKLPHTLVQSSLRELVASVLGKKRWYVDSELPYQTSSFDLRRADIAAIRRERLLGGMNFIQSAPEWVAEVLSPSNTRSQVLNTRDLCLANGCIDFWVVDPRGKRVTVYNTSSDGAVYRVGDSIPLLIEPGCSIDVASIFE